VAETREEARKRKLAQKPTKSPFDADDEALARQKARDARKKAEPKPKKKANTRRRDFRGVDGAVDDADTSDRRRRNQSTDSNQ
jgi:hypothetical protein